MTILGVPFTKRQAVATAILLPLALIAIWLGVVTYIVAAS